MTGYSMADCQKDVVPPSLLALVNMILDGSNIKHQTEHTASTHSTAMLYQSMDITKEAVQCLNCEQIPVLTADQPLFAMLREIQWTFSRPPAKMQSKQKNQLTALKSDCGLFSRLYISCRTRHGDLYELFSHENHAVQTALSTASWSKIKFAILSRIQSF